MKKVITNGAWNKLKSRVYIPPLNESFTIRKGEMEVKYSLEDGNLYKQFNHRFCPDPEKKLVKVAKSEDDIRASKYFATLNHNTH